MTVGTLATICESKNYAEWPSLKILWIVFVSDIWAWPEYCILPCKFSVPEVLPIYTERLVIYLFVKFALYSVLIIINKIHRSHSRPVYLKGTAKLFQIVQINDKRIRKFDKYDVIKNLSLVNKRGYGLTLSKS